MQIGDKDLARLTCESLTDTAKLHSERQFWHVTIAKVRNSRLKTAQSHCAVLRCAALCCAVLHGSTLRLRCK